MQVTKRTYYKALLLATIFSMNTVVSFACSVGIDMGYNKTHHEHQQSHSSDNGLAHKHDNHQTTPSQNSNEEDSNKDCCSDVVTKIIQLDKFVPDNNFLLQVPVFFLASTSLFSQATKEFKVAINLRRPFLRRSCSSYDTDIRIAIQSFQI